MRLCCSHSYSLRAVIVGVLVAGIISLPATATAAEIEPKSVTAPDEASGPPPPPPLNAFEISAVHGLQQVAVQHFRAGRFDASETLLPQL
jgi:hypothetical protein